MKDNVYIALSADFLHSGHMAVLKKGSELGSVVIGLLTDHA